MKSYFKQSTNKTLSNKKTQQIEKGIRNQFIKGSGEYLKLELEKYKHLSIIVENSPIKENTPVKKGKIEKSC